MKITESLIRDVANLAELSDSGLAHVAAKDDDGTPVAAVVVIRGRETRHYLAALEVLNAAIDDGGDESEEPA